MWRQLVIIYDIVYISHFNNSAEISSSSGFQSRSIFFEKSFLKFRKFLLTANYAWELIFFIRISVYNFKVIFRIQWFPKCVDIFSKIHNNYVFGKIIIFVHTNNTYVSFPVGFELNFRLIFSYQWFPKCVDIFSEIYNIW